MMVAKFASMVSVLAITFTSLALTGSSAQAHPSLQGAAQPITIGNAANVKQLALLEGHKQAVFSVAFSPDGTLQLWGAG